MVGGGPDGLGGAGAVPGRDGVGAGGGRCGGRGGTTACRTAAGDGRGQPGVAGAGTCRRTRTPDRSAGLRTAAAPVVGGAPRGRPGRAAGHAGALGRPGTGGFRRHGGRDGGAVRGTAGLGHPTAADHLRTGASAGGGGAGRRRRRGGGGRGARSVPLRRRLSALGAAARGRLPGPVVAASLVATAYGTLAAAARAGCAAAGGLRRRGRGRRRAGPWRRRRARCGRDARRHRVRGGVRRRRRCPGAAWRSGGVRRGRVR